MQDHTTNETQMEFEFIPLCGCGCGRPVSFAKRTKRGITKGKPLHFVHGHSYRPSVTDRFWGKINKNGPVHPVLGTKCWLWTASTYTSGYGQFWTGTSLTGAHRFAYALAHGPIPDGMNVCHRCDNKLCCNDAHHFLGTTQDNVDDLMAKGLNRQPWGERQRSAKFTEKQVIHIRNLHKSGRYSNGKLAREFGVSTTAIRDIVLRRTWKHI